MLRLPKLFITVTLLIAILHVKAQDATFTQYQSSLLYLNPAFAGEERNIELSLNYRTQWKTVSVPYNTSQLSFILPIYTGPTKKNHFGGVGLSLYTDKAGEGELKTIGGNVSLSKVVKLTPDERNTLALGLQAGAVQRSVDYDKLQWGEQYQPFLGYNSNISPVELTGNLMPKKTFLDIGAGAVYYFNDMQQYDSKELGAHLGVSAYHLNKPNESFSNVESSELPRIFKFHGGLDIPISSTFYLSPDVLTMFQGNKVHLNGGMKFIYNLQNKSPKALLSDFLLMAGVGGRLNDSFIMSAGIGNKIFRLGYSYDMNFNGIGTYTNRVGASEISFVIRNPIDHIFNSVDTPRI